MPAKNWYFVQALAANRAEVSIRGSIGEWGVTDRSFIDEVEALGPDLSEITVRINSRGGEVDHALSIFNYLLSHPAKITVQIDGVAMSAASIIAMSGDRIVMPANTIMMLHNPWTFVAGNAADLRRQADVLETFEAALRATYLRRAGVDEAELITMLAEETYLTAAEAVEKGFADEVLPLARPAAAASALAYASALGIPEDVLARVAAIEAAAAPAAERPNPPPPAAEPAAAAPQAFAPALATLVEQLAAGAGLSELAEVFTLDARITDEASARAVIATAREVAALCEVARMPGEARALIEAGNTLAEARTHLIAARAARAVPPTHSHHADAGFTAPASGQEPAAASGDRKGKVCDFKSIYEARASKKTHP